MPQPRILLGLLLAAVTCFAQTISGDTTCTTSGDYTLCQNLWGADEGTGSQTSDLISTSGNDISWSTTWTWANNENNVKSYANVNSNTAKGQQLQNIGSAPTTWDWSYESASSGIRADVSYDIWFGTASSGEPASTASSYEIMIWLSGLGGIQPVGSQTVTGLSIAGYTWNLWAGPNTNWETYSFVVQNENITSFSADLTEFFSYLVENEGVAASQRFLICRHLAHLDHVYHQDFLDLDLDLHFDFDLDYNYHLHLDFVREFIYLDQHSG
ncbi:hypothetical protein H0H92_013080 [Tricholoma furcatifolium]|nr:hypothetical protein H0H92_013080 [Tricholoma furcatifolium]